VSSVFSFSELYNLSVTYDHCKTKQVASSGNADIEGTWLESQENSCHVRFFMVLLGPSR